MNASEKNNIITALLRWYRANARAIIWRTPETSPWGILLSEVMSQQTPVARVEPIWTQWMEKWPTPRDFAQAPKDEVLRAWGSLGYPRRALRLHQCAQQIVAIHDGEVPADVEKLLALPGIGDYTARAVAAFSFGQRVAVVDTNVRRVYHRLYLGRYLAGNPSKKKSQRYKPYCQSTMLLSFLWRSWNSARLSALPRPPARSAQCARNVHG